MVIVRVADQLTLVVTAILIVAIHAIVAGFATLQNGIATLRVAAALNLTLRIAAIASVVTTIITVFAVIDPVVATQLDFNNSAIHAVRTLTVALFTGFNHSVATLSGKPAFCIAPVARHVGTKVTIFAQFNNTVTASSFITGSDRDGIRG
jgi:hypothetical protein